MPDEKKELAVAGADLVAQLRANSGEATGEAMKFIPILQVDNKKEKVTVEEREVDVLCKPRWKRTDRDENGEYAESIIPSFGGVVLKVMWQVANDGKWDPNQNKMVSNDAPNFRSSLFHPDVFFGKSAVNAFLDAMDALGVKEKHFIEGNHESRVGRMIAKHAAAFHGIVNVQKLYRLKERGYKFTAYGDYLKLGKLYVTHCINGASSPTEHIKAQAAVGGNVVIFHTHRMGLQYVGNARGETHVGAVFGCLVDKKSVATNYVARVTKARCWTHGVGIGHMEPNGTVHLQAIPFIAGKCVVNGELIQ